MPLPLNITSLPGARSQFLNADGTVDRVWYRFLLNLFNLTGAGGSDATIVDLLIAPVPADVQNLSGEAALQQTGTLATPPDLGPIYNALQDLSVSPVVGAVGFTGATGPQGLRGSPGSDGEDGADGFMMLSSTGSGSGSAGPQGPQGPPGFGFDGMDGEDGQWGAPAPPNNNVSLAMAVALAITL